MVETVAAEADFTPDRATPPASAVLSAGNEILEAQNPVHADIDAIPGSDDVNTLDPRFPLPVPRHEMFAQTLAKGTSQYNAYISAGYSPDRGGASRLAAKPSIKARVAHLQQLSADMTATVMAIDKSYVLRQAVKLHELSMSHTVDENGGFVGSAANAASRTLGQIGEHVDVQAWKAAQDINVHITVDQAIARLESQAIEADYTDVTED
jgi:phage terminase small subunit